MDPTGEVAPHPGETSAVQRGVPLDEMPESGPRIIEDLRQLLEVEVT